ncbi:hypothetical protein TIFTF001_046093 [Ficus carica]|uniref:Uncharacterized protein n=1 Tax=Ficus carica TaxID=3494 RepID=A0AA88CQA9_FICCA|nr:hypothetical protein TIFTF001_046087 [Ficus carica]GMN26785.1 hypothetical protein TIFTF001_046089 [Ficus carica]GMN26798.1 hypothetical protein TIFTF001_046091 [Ficus carica]GMN26815.1 hypothetical protein TIFTF001_046093 [Ficus carica]
MANQAGGRGACPVTVCWRGMLMGVKCGASGRAVTPVAEKSGGVHPVFSSKTERAQRVGQVAGLCARHVVGSYPVRGMRACVDQVARQGDATQSSTKLAA